MLYEYYAEDVVQRHSETRPHENRRIDQHLLQSADCAFAIPRPQPDQGLIALLPQGSFFLKLRFSLATPYVSRDDAPRDGKNPVVVEWVYRKPIVRPTSWKGLLRFAAREANLPSDQQLRLFGNDKEEKRDFREGRLHFFPSIFDSSPGTVIFNPHSRKTRAGTVPVTFGCVAPGNNGDFALLYLAPFGSTAEAEAKEDLRALGRIVSDALVGFGIGAKTRKGFGLAKPHYTCLEVWSRRGQWTISEKGDFPKFAETLAGGLDGGF